MAVTLAYGPHTWDLADDTDLERLRSSILEASRRGPVGGAWVEATTRSGGRLSLHVGPGVPIALLDAEVDAPADGRA